VPPTPPDYGAPLASLIERYRRLETALVYDVLDTMGLPNRQLSLAIQPLDVSMVVCGAAFTWKLAVGSGGGSGNDLLDRMYDGCVLVEDVGNDPVSGGLGENLGLSVQMKGCVGVVCDGGTRDKKALIQAGFPVFSRFSSMTFSRNRRRFVESEVPVRLSGHLTRWVTVNPGDIVFGDADGVLVVPAALAVEVLAAAEVVQEHEERQREQLRAGVSRAEVYRLDRYAHVRRLSPDELAGYAS
jgi:4-hydroxy-4-methyl-2-oxoglutarate aldolase